MFIDPNSTEVVYEKLSKDKVDCECIEDGMTSLYNGCEYYDGSMKCLVKGGEKSKCTDKKIYKNSTNLYYSVDLCKSDNLDKPTTPGCYYFNRNCEGQSVNKWTKTIPCFDCSSKMRR